LHIPGAADTKIKGCDDWKIFKKTICGETKYFVGSMNDKNVKERDVSVSKKFRCTTKLTQVQNKKVPRVKEAHFRS
jgi:hypothetical protein